jgi:putative inorganic carbon (HCO3(-)) transporter
MRDGALVLIFIACVPFMFKRPALGIIMWVWLSVMNPHRLTYGFAYSLQFAAATAIITLIAVLATKGEKRLPITPPVIALGLFMFWICITSLFPFHPGSGFDMWSRVMKIFLMTMVAFMVIKKKEEIHWMVWIIVFSLAFYGAKGGAFTVSTGGSYLVWGPEGSFIEGNNEIALALVMTIPLMRYVQVGLKKPWQKYGMTAVMGLSAFAAIGSHSRGALLALAAMALIMWWKSRNKFIMGIALTIVGIALITFMPAEWMARMHTIETYDEDASALGRINAWWMAFNLARDRFFGGGFEIYDFEVFAKYAPNPLDVHAAHSIFFQVLGEHGFIGLFLFISIGITTWLAASDAKRKAKGIPDLAWVGSLVDMLKVSMVGYAVGGAFLSLAYFDVPYYVTVIAVATRALAVARRKEVGNSLDVRNPHRRDFFGAVPVTEDLEDGPAPPVRPSTRPDSNWRGQGAYGKPALKTFK